MPDVSITSYIDISYGFSLAKVNTKFSRTRFTCADASNKSAKDFDDNALRPCTATLYANNGSIRF